MKKMFTKIFVILTFHFLFLSFTVSGKYTQIKQNGKGQLYEMDGTKVLYLKGNSYQMGYQHGNLLKEQVNFMVNTIVSYMDTADIKVDDKGKKLTLEDALERTMPFIPKKYIEEMHGIADGAEVPRERVLLTNIFPELFHCSGFAIFGKACLKKELLHGRVLDYSCSAGFQNNAVVIVHKPDGLNAFVNIGYSGIAGCVTGMNDKKIAIGEMGGKGEGNWDGMPMTFLFRKALEEAGTLDEAVDIFRKTPRTCEYYYVISDAKIPDARGLACTPEMFEVVEPNKPHKLLPFAIKDVILVSGGDRYKLLVERVKKKYGQLDVLSAIELMSRPVAMKSNLHNVLFRPGTLDFWVANAADPSKTETYQACNQKYYQYNLKDILSLGSEK